MTKVDGECCSNASISAYDTSRIFFLSAAEKGMEDFEQQVPLTERILRDDLRVVSKFVCVDKSENFSCLRFSNPALL